MMSEHGIALAHTTILPWVQRYVRICSLRFATLKRRARTVSVVGGSFGGSRGSAEKLKSRAFFIVARDDANGSGRRLRAFARKMKTLLSRKN
jgi:hypothetical protein